MTIYDPNDERDPCHWALWLGSSDGQSVILGRADLQGTDEIDQAEGGCPCGTIPASKHNQAVLMIQSHPVDNQSTTWNCQAWIMENLDRLGQLRLLQVSPDTKQKLQSKRQIWQ